MIIHIVTKAGKVIDGFVMKTDADALVEELRMSTLPHEVVEITSIEI
jgi:hypothetical protein